VNFQTKNETIAMTATPPATERPIIEPVPRPLESEVDDDCVADAVELEVVGVITTMLVIVKPSEFVVTTAEELSGS